MTVVQKINLSIFSFIISIILLVFFGIYPLFKEIQLNSKELVSQKNAIFTLELQIENISKLKNTYQEFQPKIKEIDNLFINPELPIEFISFLENSAKDSEVQIKISLSSLNKAEKGKWPFLNFQVNTSGAFPNFLSFFEKIENAPYLIEIQNLNINKSKENTVQANLSFKVYTQ